MWNKNHKIFRKCSDEIIKPEDLLNLFWFVVCESEELIEVFQYTTMFSISEDITNKSEGKMKISER